MKLGLIGAQGKMGSQVMSICLKESIELIPHANNKNIQDKIRFTQDKTEIYTHADVVIDFSVSAGALAHIELAELHNKPILICTTGHKELDIFKNRKVPICYAPNTSREWLLIKKCITKLFNNNQEAYISIDEVHSKTKLDSPSGTAKQLIQDLGGTINSIRSIRAGNLTSWHKVFIMDSNQVIEFNHQVLDRKLYAKGAIELAKLLLNKSPGYYSAEDLFQI